MLENLRNAGPPLGEGERSQTHRIRAADELHAWFAAMTAEERGRVIARAKAAQERAERGLERPAEAAWDWETGAELEDAVRVAEVSAPQMSPLRQRRSPAIPAGVTRLRIIHPGLPQWIKNKLRWPPENYKDLEDALRGEVALVLDVTNGKAVWRTSKGEAVRKDTVRRLLEAGSLTPDDMQQPDAE